MHGTNMKMVNEKLFLSLMRLQQCEYYDNRNTNVVLLCDLVTEELCVRSKTTYVTETV